MLISWLNMDDGRLVANLIVIIDSLVSISLLEQQSKMECTLCGLYQCPCTVKVSDLMTFGCSVSMSRTSMLTRECGQSFAHASREHHLNKLISAPQS